MSKKTLAEKVAEEPAKILDNSITAAQKVNKNIKSTKIVKRAKNYWYVLGPGLTTGASDDDPSGITTYSQAGAKYGFGMLWLAAFTFPLMSAVQEMCARIGLVTGRGLAGNIRQHFSKKIIMTTALLLFGANAFNIGANLGAMAKAVQLLQPSWNFGLLVLTFTVVSIGLQIFTPYERYAKYLKWLALVLLAYIASAILADLNWNDVLRSALVPKLEFSKDQILLLCAILGTTISPYLFFWQTSQEIEEQIQQGKTTVALRTGSNKKEIKNMRLDVWSGMFLSNVVMFFIIAACGAVLFQNGITEITSASQAAEALRPFAGDATYWLFALGVIGTGLLSIPVLAGSSSYALSEGMGWRAGLSNNLRQARSFYGVIILSVGIGFGLNFVGIDPIKALIYSAVANGIIAPVILTLIVLISSNKKIMGDWTNKPLTTLLGWVVVAIMGLSGMAAIVSLFI
jgi:NRAMP (natural resistance-associated macrophage protein)-like metal ion transporter